MSAPADESRGERNARWWRDVPWDDVAHFIGPNAERFHSAWSKTRAKSVASGSGIAWTWSWPALLFGFAWFFYRKQWGVGTVLLIGSLVTGYLLDRASSGLLGVAIVVAALAKSLIVQDAVLKVGAIRDRGGSGDAIAAAGGVSLAGGIAGGAVLALATALGILAIVAGDRL